MKYRNVTLSVFSSAKPIILVSQAEKKQSHQELQLHKQLHPYIQVYPFQKLSKIKARNWLKEEGISLVFENSSKNQIKWQPISNKDLFQ